MVYLFFYLDGYFSSEDEKSSNYNDDIWNKHRKHILILTFSGKPIYSLYGDTLSISGLTGIIQAIISRLKADNNDLKYYKFIFIVIFIQIRMKYSF